MKTIANNIPVGVIITLIIQTSALFMWGGQITEKVSAMEKEAGKHENEDKEFQESMQSINTRLTTIETILKQHSNERINP